MREWPADGSPITAYNAISPLVNIMHEGYSLERKPVMHFLYHGLNIGKADRLYNPTPDERFTGRWLTNDMKFNRTLLDNVLITAFQLGIEQGRRLEYNNKLNIELLQSILYARNNTVKYLRAKLAEYDESFIDTPIPLEMDTNCFEGFEDEEIDNENKISCTVEDDAALINTKEEDLYKEEALQPNTRLG